MARGCVVLWRRGVVGLWRPLKAGAWAGQGLTPYIPVVCWQGVIRSWDGLGVGGGLVDGYGAPGSSASRVSTCVQRMRMGVLPRRGFLTLLKPDKILVQTGVWCLP